MRVRCGRKACRRWKDARVSLKNQIVHTHLDGRCWRSRSLQSSLAERTSLSHARDLWTWCWPQELAHTHPISSYQVPISYGRFFLSSLLFGGLLGPPQDGRLIPPRMI